MVYRFGDFALDPDDWALHGHGRSVALEPQVFRVLLHLIEHRDRVVSKDELIEHVWDGRIVSDATLNSRINAVRSAVNDTGKAQAVVRTFPRRGYKFVADVTECSPEAAVGVNRGAATSEVVRTEAADTSRYPTIAVLPFEGLSDSREVEFLADGLTEDVITLLARVPGFFVIASGSAFTYKGASPQVRAVATDLAVRYVVEGTLRPIGERFRITAQLIDAESGRYLWAEHFDAGIDQIQDVQSELAAQIVAQLEPAMARAEVALARRRPPSDLDAWVYYRQVSVVLHERGWQPDAFIEATALLHAALALDPDFALGHAQLALVIAFGLKFGIEPPGRAAEELVVTAVERAMTLDGRNPTVLSLVGCALADIGHSARAEAMLKRAIELDPSNSQAMVSLGATMIGRGRPREAIALLRSGMRISPRDDRLAFWGTILAMALLRCGLVGEALTEARLAVSRNDRFHLSRVILALALLRANERRAAAAALTEALRIRADLTADDVRGFIGGRGVEALRCIGLPA